jgi:hypothetical protein
MAFSLGTFLAHPSDVPPGVVAHLDRQLGIGRRGSELPGWPAAAPSPSFHRSAVVMPHGLDHRPAGRLALAASLDARVHLG